MKRGVVNGEALEDIVEPTLHKSEVVQMRVKVKHVHRER